MVMNIDGGCHCGNISFVFRWPRKDPGIPVRACGCSFCTAHGAAYTSHRDSALTVRVQNPSGVSRYRFGTRTADFHVCSTCGAIPLITSEIDGRLYAVVNVNTFRGVDPERCERAVTDFDGEDTDDRLLRRSKTWIPDVEIIEEVEDI